MIIYHFRSLEEALREKEWQDELRKREPYLESWVVVQGSMERIGTTNTVVCGYSIDLSLQEVPLLEEPSARMLHEEFLDKHSLTTAPPTRFWIDRRTLRPYVWIGSIISRLMPMPDVVN
jgi:hypothetical protein